MTKISHGPKTKKDRIQPERIFLFHFQPKKIKFTALLYNSAAIEDLSCNNINVQKSGTELAFSLSFFFLFLPFALHNEKCQDNFSHQTLKVSRSYLVCEDGHCSMVCSHVS
jgi:hypothetical protein